MTVKEYSPKQIPSEYSSELKNTIGSMLFRDERQRPDVDNLLKNIFKSYKMNRRSVRMSTSRLTLGARPSPLKEKTSRLVRSPDKGKEGFDRSKYEGQMLDGQRHGKGTISVLSE